MAATKQQEGGEREGRGRARKSDGTPRSGTMGGGVSFIIANKRAWTLVDVDGSNCLMESSESIFPAYPWPGRGRLAGRSVRLKRAISDSMVDLPKRGRR